MVVQFFFNTSNYGASIFNFFIVVFIIINYLISFHLTLFNPLPANVENMVSS